MTTVAARERWLHRNFACQLEFLIDGVDIDEEWCDKFLSDYAREVYSTRQEAENGLSPKI
jgi:hypothetical protein